MAKTVSEYVNDKFDGRHASVALNSLVGKFIAPPPREIGAYDAAKYRIERIGLDTSGKNPLQHRIFVARPIRKREPGGPFFTVCKTRFTTSPDEDSIWKKFIVLETTTMQGLSPAEIVALNNVRSRAGDNSCVNCGKQMTPLFGTMYGCLQCER